MTRWMRGPTMPSNSLSQICLEARRTVGENLLLACVLEKFSKFCFDAKGTHAQCIRFEMMHDYSG